MAVQPLLTAAQVRARRPRRLKPTDDDAIDLYVVEFGEIAEDYLGVACPPRESTYTGKARNGWMDLPDVQVTACTVVDENDGCKARRLQIVQQRRQALIRLQRWNEYRDDGFVRHVLSFSSCSVFL